jgi:hypothetical protein
MFWGQDFGPCRKFSSGSAARYTDYAIPPLNENNQFFVNWYFTFGKKKFCTFEDLYIYI